MSRGFGAVQRQIVTTLESNPDQNWTLERLARVVYPHKAIGASQRESVRRALAKLDGHVSVKKCRTGSLQTGGWHHTFRA